MSYITLNYLLNNLNYKYFKYLVLFFFYYCTLFNEITIFVVYRKKLIKNYNKKNVMIALLNIQSSQSPSVSSSPSASLSDSRFGGNIDEAIRYITPSKLLSFCLLLPEIPCLRIANFLCKSAINPSPVDIISLLVFLSTTELDNSLSSAGFMTSCSVCIKFSVIISLFLISSNSSKLGRFTTLDGLLTIGMPLFSSSFLKHSTSPAIPGRSGKSAGTSIVGTSSYSGVIRLDLSFESYLYF
ncbi:hypothetical protein AGLY_003907 [Aphis glycines]|uniref:Uncharacterized protein n=1 Tax=Aphis glycines TaxID=307491 RepID=A0A6G0TWK6_APHGL|nr:hypothetical protein AGLY_003907 [Aphis glycines]